MPIVFAVDAPRLINQMWLPLLLPLMAGALAILWLLPRPRPYPALWGGLAGGAALLLAGLFTIRAAGLTPETVLFYAFAGIAVLAGALLITQRNPARAALSFALVVLSTCGLFLLLAAPFLMAATIIIYAGAIVVTFLFVLMLAQQEGASDADDRSREPLLATLTGFVLLGALLYVLTGDELRADRLLASIDRASTEAALTKARELRMAPEAEGADRKLDRPFVEVVELLRRWGQEELARRAEDASVDWSRLGDSPPERYAQEMAQLRAMLVEGREAYRLGIRLSRAEPGPTPARLSSLSGTPPTVPPEEVRRDPKTRLPAMPADNPAFLGRSLFTDYLLPVELAGSLLLVATVGAIAIAQRRAAPGRSA